jgi:hypothetical protein
MRSLAAALLLLFVSAIPARAADLAPRYGTAPDLNAYPQATPQQALASVLKAAEDKRFDYLVAHLADPAFVDDRVQRLFGGKFALQVEDTRTRFDPTTVKLLGRFLKDGKWTIEGDQAVVRLDDVKDRAVFFKKVEGRWRLEHRNRPD